VAVASVAACSSSSGKGGTAEGGASDGALVDQVNEAAVETSTGADASDASDASDEVPVLPDAFFNLSPDGCALTGASCLDDSTCCTSLCVDGGCTRLPAQQ
jgi:hypothetical protein